MFQLKVSVSYRFQGISRLGYNVSVVEAKKGPKPKHQGMISKKTYKQLALVTIESELLFVSVYVICSIRLYLNKTGDGKPTGRDSWIEM